MQSDALKYARKLVAITLSAWLLLLLASPVRADEHTAWSGEWQTNWHGGLALMLLQQDGNQVTGTFEPGGGEIQGEVTGGVLRGTWQQVGSSGGFIFALSENRQTFTGRFANGEYWNGVRVEEDDSGRTRFTASFAPRETLRTVMASLNEAVYERNSSAARFFGDLLLFENANVSTRERNRRLRLIWQVLDLATFRIYDAPDRPDGNTATFAIGPTDSRVTYELRFQLGDDDIWRIAVDPEHVLQEVRASFLAELGYEHYKEARIAQANSPRGVMRTFLTGMRDWENGGSDAALSVLDLSYLPNHMQKIEGPIVADYLRQVIDRIGYVIWQELPNSPETTSPYLHYRHPVGDIVIERLTDEEGKPARWAFSSETLQAIPDLFAAIQDLPVAAGLSTNNAVTRFFNLRETVRHWSPRLLDRDLQLENWQWLALLVVILASAAAAWASAWLLWLSVALALKDRKAVKTNDAWHSLVWPLRIAVFSIGLLYSMAELGLLHSGFGYGARIVGLVATVGTIFLVFRIIGVIGGYFVRKAQEDRSPVDEIAASLATGLIKLAVVIFGIFAAADVVGLPYEGVITGLGVGGIALAFAARDTVSNMLGGAILMADRPFKRGDMVATSDELAIVENVGLRSTRMRTLDDSLLIIPNAQLVDRSIVNWGKRRKRRVILQIGLTYETPRAKLDKFVERLKEVYKEQPRADAADYTVGLKEFAASSIDIELRGYFNVYGYEAQVASQHQLVGDIIDLASEIGVSFAFPTRTIHLERAARGDVPDAAAG